MCTRTKYAYGCGHSPKETVPCHSSRCSGEGKDIQRFHFLKSGDCRSCKIAGATSTRGKDGLGRYGKKLRDYTWPREPLHEVEGNLVPQPIAIPPPQPHNVVGDNFTAAAVEDPEAPWAAGPSREGEARLWSTSPRRMADEAWLKEHEERKTISTHSTPRRNHSVSHSHTHAPAHEQDHELAQALEAFDISEQEDRSGSRRHEVETEDLHREVRRIADRERQRRRQDSYDSFDDVDIEVEHRIPGDAIRIEMREPEYASHTCSQSHKHGRGLRSRGPPSATYYSSSPRPSLSHRKHHGGVYGSYDSGYGSIGNDPYNYGYSHGYEYAYEPQAAQPQQNYHSGFGLGHGIGSVMRFASDGPRPRGW